MMPGTNLVFLESITRTSKNDKEYSQIVLGDPLNYGRYIFYKRNDLDISQIQNGDTVKATFEFTQQGYKTNVGLSNLVKV